MIKLIFTTSLCVLFLTDSCLAVTTIDPIYKKNSCIEYLTIILNDKKNLTLQFKKFCRRPKKTTSNAELIGYCQAVMRIFSGSQINCVNCSGIWVDGVKKVFFKTNGKIVKFINNHGTFTTEYSYQDQYITVKISDNAGNYVTIKMTGNHSTLPENYTFGILDARLPDMASTAVSFISRVNNPSITVKHNALITLLNEGYKYTNLPYHFYAIDLLTNLEFRRSFLEAASTWR